MTDQVQKALRAIKAAAGRLENPQGRIARRNARRAVAGALKSFRLALNKSYPPMRKDGTVAAPSAPDYHLRRPFDDDGALIFCRIMIEKATDKSLTLPPEIRYVTELIYTKNPKPDFCRAWNMLIRLADAWTNTQKWETVLHQLTHQYYGMAHGPRFVAGRRYFLEELAAFFRGELLVQDLELAAAYRAWAVKP